MTVAQPFTSGCLSRARNRRFNQFLANASMRVY
jgi:hypothetical protein